MAAGSAGCPGTPALARSCCLPCLLPNMYLRSVLTNTGDETGGEEGTEGEERQGEGSRASCHHGLQQTGAPSPAQHRPIWARGWEQPGWEACLSSPDRRRGPLTPCEEPQLNEILEGGSQGEPLLPG